MSDSQKSWSDWTKSTKASDLEKIRQELEQIRKWQRTHLGADFAASGIDYPHPSQKVRTLVFYEGNGRLSNAGFQTLVQLDGAAYASILWLPELSDTPSSVYPRASLSASMDSAANVVATYGAYAASEMYASLSLTGNSFPGDPSIARLKAVNVDAGLGFNNPTAEIYVSSTAQRYFKLFNAPLYLQGVSADFTSLSDGMLWYRSDLDKFRARANSVTENLAFESDIPTSMNVQPYAAKTTTYTTTNADGVISVDATSASFTVTLVTAVGNSGLTQTFKKINATNVVTIDANSTQTIDGVLTYALSAQWSWVTLVSNGANWLITGAG